MYKKTVFITIALTIFAFTFPNFIKAENKVSLNEFLAHPGSGNKEWVEFYHPEGADLASFWLDDDTDFVSDTGSSAKKSLSTVANGKDTNHSYIELSSSMLNNDNDHIVLFDAQGNIIDQYEYTKDPGMDISIGRSPDGTGQFQILAAATKGEANTNPVPTSTPTPLPTATNYPTAKTPTSPKSPTPTPLRQGSAGQAKTPTPTKYTTETSLPTSKVVYIQKSKSSVPNETVNLSGVPTSILGASTQSADKKISSASPTKKDKKILVKDSNQSNLLFSPLLLIPLIGVLFISISGIVFYQRIRKKNTAG